MIDIHPYMINVSVQLVCGSNVLPLVCGGNVLQSFKTKFAVADNNQFIMDKVSWNNITISKLPMESTVVFKLQLFSKEGEGIVCGVGAMKLFDEYGYLLQGEQ